MESLQKQISFEDERVGCMKFLRQSHLIVSHGKAVSVLSVGDNYSHRYTQTPMS